MKQWKKKTSSKTFSILEMSESYSHFLKNTMKSLKEILETLYVLFCYISEDVKS